MYLVLTGAITRAVAAEVAGQDPSLEQSYRFGFHRLGPVLGAGRRPLVACLRHPGRGGAAHRHRQRPHHHPLRQHQLVGPGGGGRGGHRGHPALGVLVGVLLYLDLRARKENLTLDTLRTDLQASAA